MARLGTEGARSSAETRRVCGGRNSSKEGSSHGRSRKAPSDDQEHVTRVVACLPAERHPSRLLKLSYHDNNQKEEKNILWNLPEEKPGTREGLPQARNVELSAAGRFGDWKPDRTCAVRSLPLSTAQDPP